MLTGHHGCTGSGSATGSPGVCNNSAVVTTSSRTTCNSATVTTSSSTTYNSAIVTASSSATCNSATVTTSSSTTCNSAIVAASSSATCNSAIVTTSSSTTCKSVPASLHACDSTQASGRRPTGRHCPRHAVHRFKAATGGAICGWACGNHAVRPAATGMAATSGRGNLQRVVESTSQPARRRARGRDWSSPVIRHCRVVVGGVGACQAKRLLLLPHRQREAVTVLHPLLCVIPY